jgi:hypothetical protein
VVPKSGTIKIRRSEAILTAHRSAFLPFAAVCVANALYGVTFQNTVLCTGSSFVDYVSSPNLSDTSRSEEHPPLPLNDSATLGQRPQATQNCVRFNFITTYIFVFFDYVNVDYFPNCTVLKTEMTPSLQGSAVRNASYSFIDTMPCHLTRFIAHDKSFLYAAITARWFHCSRRIKNSITLYTPPVSAVYLRSLLDQVSLIQKCKKKNGPLQKFGLLFS